MIPGITEPLTYLGTLPDLRWSFRLILRPKLLTSIHALLGPGRSQSFLYT
jgi:hypothetical protein